MRARITTSIQCIDVIVVTPANYTRTCSDSCTHVGPPLLATMHRIFFTVYSNCTCSYKVYSAVMLSLNYYIATIITTYRYSVCFNCVIVMLTIIVCLLL